MSNLAGIPIDFKAIEWDVLLSFGSIFTSVILVASIVFLRGFLIRRVRKDVEILANDQRRWIIRIKNTAMIVIVLGLVLIWAPQLHTFALSITAFAVALVIAMKEMILCLMGALMHATSQPFKVGEWVSIDGVTGEVIDHDAFAFRLQEVDMEGKTYQFTGRTITVPNSALFTSKIINANFFKAYIFEDVRVAVQYTDVDPAAALEALKSVVEKHFTPLRKDAVSFNKKIRKRAAIDVGSAEPVYDLTTSELGHYQFHARVFVPTSMASDIGSEISKEFLSRIYRMRRKEATASQGKAIEEEMISSTEQSVQ
jgi:small-conductance mechanosensitive channel